MFMLAPALARGDGTDADYLFDALVAAQDQHFWFRARNALIGWAVREYFPKAESLLDLGCGTGGVSAYLRTAFPGLRIVATDVLEDGLSRARGRLAGVSLLQMDARQVPFETEFDVIGAFDVIEHIQDDDATLREMFRATRPGGGAVITVPQHQALWSALDEFSHHCRRYSRGQAVTKVTQAGYRILCVTSFVSLLLPALLVSRLRQRGNSLYDPLSEYRIGPSLNRSLELVMGLERRLIRMGCRLPAGGSLLVVASRPADKN
jgi:SAM-dependent methyltransferase